MSRLIAMCCDIDDLCTWCAPLYVQRLLHNGQRPRVRPSQLGLSELMTIVVYCHSRHSRDFKHSSPDYVATHLRPYFPTLVSYSRFVEWMPRALVPLCGYLHTRQGHCTGSTFVDSTPLAVCHNRRIARHKVFAGAATRGKASMGWFCGFRLHLMVNDAGELLAVRVTTGEVSAQEPVGRMAKGLWGQLFGDRGSSSRALHQALWARGLALITHIRRTMKPRLMRLWDWLLLCQRFLSETINDQLKHISQIEPTRPRSLTGCMGNLAAGLIAYTYQPTKPSLGVRLWGEAGLPGCAG